MIAALLAWTKLRPWAMDLIALVLVASIVWYWQHERYESGIRAQQTADDQAKIKLIDETNEKTAALKAQATTAEDAYDAEHQNSLDYQRDHPDEPVRLCLSAPVGRGGVSKAGGAHAGNVGAGAGPATVSKVHDGDSGSGQGAIGPDIAGMLEALAGTADDVGSRLREFQAR